MAQSYPKNYSTSILNNSKKPEKSDTFRIKLFLNNNSVEDETSPPKTSIYRFISMKEQRVNKWVHGLDKPLRSYPILDKTAFATCSDYYSPACEQLMNDFLNRTLIWGSLGKQENNDNSMSFHRFLNKDGKHFGQALFECTHFTFTVSFPDKYYDSEKKKKVTVENVMYPVLIIDIDDFDGDLGVFERYNIIPNYLVRNPKKPKSLQVGYVLSNPVFKKKSDSFESYEEFNDKFDPKPLPFAKQPPQIHFITAYNNLVELLNGDPLFKLHNAKNPFFASEVGDVAWTKLPPYDIYELAEQSKDALSEYRDTHNQAKDTAEDPSIDFADIENHVLTDTDKNLHYRKDPESRNCQLFDEMRVLAYEVSSLYVETNAAKAFYAYLFKIANSKNNELYGLPLNEVKATIRSIVKYCFTQKLDSIYPSYRKRRVEKMNQIKDYMLKTYGPNYRYRKAEKELLAQKFGVKPDTIKTYSAQIRKEHGTMDEKAMILQQIIALRSTTPPTKWARIAEMVGKSEDNVRMMYKRNQGKTA
ncbi:hypothetical protein BKG92_06185 [Rodentibacter ratti]|uniref:Primase C-terminal 1 domain-containing protein n=1 Tax=Rodentibacter ratti TaxID=1906745 RepID=A0A1V3KYB3_9PAST|nr:primase C-terminal domain-containing protein [Rodentibacter ratti]OOF82672.1 hypothetical protein BKG92_06185 [Rodentibacter ratti]